MSTNPKATARIIGAPPIPTSNPAGDQVVTPRQASTDDDKPDLVAVLMGRLRAAVRRARAHTHV